MTSSEIKHELKFPRQRFTMTMGPPCLQNLQLLYIPPSNVGLCNSQHVDGGLVQFDKDTIEDLAETKQLKHLADFGADTIDADDRKGTSSKLLNDSSNYLY